MPTLPFEDPGVATDGAKAGAVPEPERTGAVLIVDTEIGMQRFLQRALSPHFGRVDIAGNPAQARALAQRASFDFLVTAIRLQQGLTGVDLARELRDRGNVDMDVIFITGSADVYAEIDGLRDDAADVLRKPFHTEHLLALIRRAKERRRSARETYLHNRQREMQRAVSNIIGETKAVQEILETIQRIAPMPSTVLIKGETGTGKELIARALHELSGRDGSYVPVNCGAISPDLIEGELFGHLKGAFTGAHQARNGLFRHADDGTLFLDEIGEMPMALQAKLLRVLQEKSYRPVGGNQEIPVNTRVIAATNRDLAAEVRAGRFRQDLYYRINVVDLRLPPLRERKNDIPALTRYFLDTLSAELGLTPPDMDPGDMHQLISYDWPGNIRELRNVIERALLLGKPPSCCLADATARKAVPDDLGDEQEVPAAASFGGPQSLETMQRQHIMNALVATGGNKTAAARNLGVSRKTIERKLKEWSNASIASGAG